MSKKIGFKIYIFLIFIFLVITGCASETVIKEDETITPSSAEEDSGNNELPKNIIVNGDFSNPDLGDWDLFLGGDGDAIIEVTDGELFVDVINGGNERWHVQLRQLNRLIKKGAKYVVSFDARAVEPRRIESQVGKNSEPWTEYSEEGVFEITTDMQTYTYEFVMTHESDLEGRFLIDFGRSDSDVYIDNVFVWQKTPGEEPSSVPEEEVISEDIPEPAQGEWVLIWNDEFDGTEINLDDWSFNIGTGNNGWGNNELQYYTDRPENVRIEDNILVIEARKENYEDSEYTSARIKTEDKQSWAYGKIEARIKLPQGKGIWPAFWMLGESINTINWPYCGEIDVMEMIGGGSNDSICHGTIHWDKDGWTYTGGNTTLSSGIFADDYHIFSIEWDKGAIRWFLDGKQYHAENITHEHQSELHDSFFIILNCAIGGNWPGSPSQSTVFPQKMYIDWIRVYQKVESV
ncbi:MAG: family 16 glycosylhydrolase [Actinobacteria bacterium]|nr:family 16 glycosylhydrolase [Actinomycetota bacterium]